MTEEKVKQGEGLPKELSRLKDQRDRWERGVWETSYFQYR